MAKKPAPAFDIPRDEPEAQAPDEAVAAGPLPPPASAPQRGRPPKAAPAAAERKSESPYKVGKRNLSVYIPEAAHRQFKSLAVEDGITVQDYVCRLLNQEFARRGRKQLA